MGKNKGMFIPHEFARSVWRLSDEDAGLLLKACFDYFEGFTEAEVADSIKEIWAEFKASFEEEARRYEAKCAKNRACIMQRWKTKDTNVLRTYYERTNQESEREREGDEEKRSKREGEDEKAKEKEREKEKPKRNETDETNKQAEMFEPEEAHKKAKAPQFQKPSVADVAEYVKAKGYEQLVDPEEFWHFYESKDWMVGKSKMKKWHSAVVTWVKARKQRQQQRTPHGTSVGERAYNMLHFSAEGHPEVWEEEERIMKELQKYL